MSNDPLALSGITAGLSQDAEYEAVYAAVTATERGRWFLTEFASRNRHADTDVVVGAIARIEAAIRGDAAGTELKYTPDIAAAADRIQDIAFQLRERAADAALCDALDAALREISEACADGAADRGATNGAAPPARNTAITPVEPPTPDDDSLASLLRDDKKFAAAAAALAASLSSLAGDSPTAGEPQSQSFDTAIPPHDVEEAPEPRAAEPADRHPPWYIEPPDFVIAPADRKSDNDDIESSEQSGQAHPLLPGPQLLPDPEDDPADLFEPTPQSVGIPPHLVPVPSAVMPAPAATAPPPAVAARTEPSPPQLRIAAGSAIRPVPRPVPNPLATLSALSEEELIALFG